MFKVERESLRHNTMGERERESGPVLSLCRPVLALFCNASCNCRGEAYPGGGAAQSAAVLLFSSWMALLSGDMSLPYKIQWPAA